MHTHTHSHTIHDIVVCHASKIASNKRQHSQSSDMGEQEQERVRGRLEARISRVEEKNHTNNGATIMQATVCAQHVPISLLLVAFRSCWNENSQLILLTAIAITITAATIIRSIGKFCFVISDNEHNEHLRDTTQLPSKLIYVCRAYNKPTEQISLRKMHLNNRLLGIALLRTYRRVSQLWLNAWENSALMR